MASVEARQRLRVALQGRERRAEIAVRGGDGRIERDGLADQLDGLLRFAGLQRNDAQQMRGLEGLGILLEDIAINLLGLGKAALLMQGHALAEFVLDRRGIVFCGER